MITRVAILPLIAIAYAMIRWGIDPDTGFWRNHATDVLAGMAMPGIAAFLAHPESPAGRWVRSYKGMMIMGLCASIYWEAIWPHIDHTSTADPFDVLAYMAGTILVIAAVFAKNQRAPLHYANSA